MNKELFLKSWINSIREKFSLANDDKAFEILAIAAITEKSFQEVYDNILIKGDLDGGVDGVLFTEQGNSYYLMQVIQCKNYLGLKQKDIDDFRSDTEDIFTHGIKKINTRDLQPKIDEYNQLTQDLNTIDMFRYFVYRGDNNDINKGANLQLFKAYNKLNDFEIWDSNRIFAKINSLIESQNKRNNLLFTFNPENTNAISSDTERQALYSYSIENVRAVNFRIKASELCSLIDEELRINHTYDTLFAENIRGFFKFGRRPNRRMRETLLNSDKAIYFPLLNNGLTIICKKFTLKSPQGGVYLLPTENPLIVNGLQTALVIYEISQEGKKKGIDYLKNVFVNIRIYETDDKTIIEEITDATNTQTPINYRDKVSNKDFNSYVKELFEHNGIGYINKRGEFFSSSSIKKAKETIDSDNLMKYWYATFYEKPEIAKNSIATVSEAVYDATNGDNSLKKLFNGDENSPLYGQLLHVYRIYKFVQKKNRENQTTEFVAHTNELLSYGIYKHLESNLSEIGDESKIQKAYKIAFEIISKNVEKEIKEYETQNRLFSYNNYFKNSKSRTDYNASAGITEIDSKKLVEKLEKKFV